MSDAPTRVLIVDDDNEDYLIACDLLRDVQHHRYVTTWAGDVETGLREIETGNYDACLLDYRIGSATGLDFLRELSSRKTSKTPVIMLTGSANREVDLEAMQHGVSDFIVKGALTAAALERTIRYCIERAATLADLAKKNEELARLNEQKNRFVGMAAHDLRSPLAIIGLSSDLLLAGDAGGLSEDQSILIGRIHALSDFMHRLVNDMLDLTQIEAGKLALNRQTTDLALLAKQNVALNALVAERKKINIELDVTGPLHARVDAVKMDQVLNNLLLNAIAFT
jgi:signal transduction histidine kinase